MSAPVMHKNFSWSPNQLSKEDKSLEEQFMDFCNNLNDQGFEIMFATSVGRGKVVHCKLKPDDEFKA